MLLIKRYIYTYIHTFTDILWCGFNDVDTNNESRSVLIFKSTFYEKFHFVHIMKTFFNVQV